MEEEETAAASAGEQEKTAAASQDTKNEETASAGAPVGPSGSFSLPSVTVPSDGLLLVGLSLVIVSSVTGGLIREVWDAVWNDKPGGLSKANVVQFGGEILFVVVLSFVGSLNADVSHIILALFLALWVVWAVNNAAKITKFSGAIGALTK